jgi:GH15 family glucan-1,4-alpha-glucosidase
VEIINQGLIRPESALSLGSLSAWMALQAPSGGFRRNDDGTGSSNPFPWYDDQEWVFIDLRMALAMKKVGDATGNATLQHNAEVLLTHVTELGTANYGLLPELVSDGTWTPEDDADHFGIGLDGGQESQGANPMAGFGAGAYILALQGMR